MNPTHVHLLLNHIPILGSAFGAILLLYGIISKNKSIINTALLAFVIVALFTIPVFLTGEPSEDSIENISGISKASIEEHEESAEFAMWIMEALGTLSLITYILNLKDHSLRGKLVIATFILSLLTFALMARTGSEGGKIRHTELTNSGQTPGGNERETKHSSNNHED